MNLAEKRKDPFLSYSRENLEQALLLRIQLTRRGVGLVWDRDDLQVGDSISEFMESVQDWPEVILLVSDSYLRSVSCMREVLAVMDGERPFLRMKPLILPSARIFTPEGRAEYVRYWSTEYQRLQEQVAGISGKAASRRLLEDLGILERICEMVDEFLACLADRYSATDIQQFVEHFCAEQSHPPSPFDLQ